MHHAAVLGTTIAHRELGERGHDGPPMVFVHGNPTSSYVWRRHNVPEDQPDAIARAITDWADRHHLRDGSRTVGESWCA